MFIVCCVYRVELVVESGDFEIWMHGRVDWLYECASSSADTSNSYVAKYRLVSVLLQCFLYLFCIIACSAILWSKFTFEIIMTGPMGLPIEYYSPP